jgi:putative transposase
MRTVRPSPLADPQGLRTAVFDFIEIYYNRQHRHSTLDYASPASYEQQHLSPAPAA